MAIVSGGDAQDAVGQMRRNLRVRGPGHRQGGRGRRAARRVRRQGGRRPDQAGRAGRPAVRCSPTGTWRAARSRSGPSPRVRCSAPSPSSSGCATPGPSPATSCTGWARPTSRGSPRRGDASFIYIANDADGGDPFATVLTDNAVWKSLPFVQEQRRAPAARRHLDVRWPDLHGAVRRRGRDRARQLIRPGRRDAARHRPAAGGRPHPPAGRGRGGRRRTDRRGAAGRGAPHPGHRRRRRRRPAPAGSAADPGPSSRWRSWSPPGCRGCWPGCWSGWRSGLAGAALQSVARNPLAAPDTLAVDSGAYLLLVLAIALRLALPVPFAGALAFLGGLAAAALVLGLASGAGAGPTRLVLAGIGDRDGAGLGHRHPAAAVPRADRRAVRLGQRLAGPVRPDRGSPGWRRSCWSPGPALMTLAGRLDIHGLGDDAAAVLGREPAPDPAARGAARRAAERGVGDRRRAGRLRRAGRAGDRAPARAAGARAAAAPRPAAGVRARRVVVVLGADVLAAARARRAGSAGSRCPTGVVTSAFGAVFLVVLACRFRSSGPVRPAPAAAVGAAARARPGSSWSPWPRWCWSWRRCWPRCCSATRCCCTGDVANWLSGRAGPVVTSVLDQRVPAGAGRRGGRGRARGGRRDRSRRAAATRWPNPGSSA